MVETRRYRKLVDVQNHPMRIVVDFPPNLDEIDAAIPGVKRNAMNGIYFCYGDIIFNPSGKIISVPLLAHECTHSMQQADIGVEAWWDRYLANKTDRLDFELEAHRVEYEKIVTEGHGRPFRRRYLAGCAERLAGPLYGRMLKKKDAKKLIAQGDVYD